MKIIDRKYPINRRQNERLIIVKTAIHRVSYLNRTVLGVGAGIAHWCQLKAKPLSRRDIEFITLGVTPP